MNMSKVEKLLDKMRNNPRDWQIDILKDLARRFGIEWRQPGTSHVTFRHPSGAKHTVPAHKPIKPIYIKKFIRLIDEGEGE
jgi:predicted RNA binding protein YcfA (HicA-like mRNA interferase family)